MRPPASPCVCLLHFKAAIKYWMWRAQRMRRNELAHNLSLSHSRQINKWAERSNQHTIESKTLSDSSRSSRRRKKNKYQITVARFGLNLICLALFIFILFCYYFYLLGLVLLLLFPFASSCQTCASFDWLTGCCCVLFWRVFTRHYPATPYTYVRSRLLRVNSLLQHICLGMRNLVGSRSAVRHYCCCYVFVSLSHTQANLNKWKWNS